MTVTAFRNGCKLAYSIEASMPPLTVKDSRSPSTALSGNPARISAAALPESA